MFVNPPHLVAPTEPLATLTLFSTRPLPSQIQALQNPADKRPEYFRPVWVAGITSYILSQLVGSTLALQYLRAEFVAPLGSSSLVFNFLFARWLVSRSVVFLRYAKSEADVFFFGRLRNRSGLVSPRETFWVA